MVYNGLSVNSEEALLRTTMSFLVSYTWSHAIDDSTDVISTSDAPQSNFAPNAERGTSSFDQRHRLVLSGVYNTGHIGGSGFRPADLLQASPWRRSLRSLRAARSIF